MESNLFYNESENITKEKWKWLALGMHFRVALSLLIDGDRTDTACFSRMYHQQREFHWMKRKKFGAGMYR